MDQIKIIVNHYEDNSCNVSELYINNVIQAEYDTEKKEIDLTILEKYVGCTATLISNHVNNIAKNHIYLVKIKSLAADPKGLHVLRYWRDSITIYITQILKDVRSTGHIYNHLEQTEIETFTSYKDAKDYLESKHDDIKYNHFKYAEKVKENEDYLDVDFCEEIGDVFCFRITDSTDWFSGQILKREI